MTRVHPVPLLLWALALSGAGLATDHPLVLLLLLASLLPVVHRLGAWAEWRSYSRVAVWTGLLLLLVNPIFAPGGSHVLLRLDALLPDAPRLVITLESIAFALAMGVRLGIVIGAFAVVAARLDHDALLSLLAARVRPAAVLPFGLAARFAPVVMADAAAIADAQRARGLKLDERGPVRRARAGTHIVLPLLANSLERASSLAEAMEARAFGSGPRTRYRPLAFGRRDAAQTLAALVPLVAVLVASLLGFLEFRYYPTMRAPDLPPAILLAVGAASLAFPSFLGRERA